MELFNLALVIFMFYRTDRGIRRLNNVGNITVAVLPQSSAEYGYRSGSCCHLPQNQRNFSGSRERQSKNGEIS